MLFARTGRKDDLVVRMAVLYDLLTTGPAMVKTPEPLEVA